MRRPFCRAASAALFTVVSACAETVGPPDTVRTPSVDSTAVARNFVVDADGHSFYYSNGELSPIGPFDAKIVRGSAYTRFYLNCGIHYCTGEIRVNHSGYWHGTSQVLSVRLWDKAGVLLQNTVTLSGFHCQSGWPCLWKEAPNTYPLPTFRSCGTSGTAYTAHEAWWFSQANISANGVSFAIGRFGSVNDYSNDGFQQDACPPPITVNGGGLQDGCWYCQLWLIYQDSELIEQKWECTYSTFSCPGAIA